ncbi:IclR family transcriptional regulator [Ahrensia kielensis]|uniref:IclR family transcriptional regulator n=1 Tax=Ahrensia kielensis TaxID=76980 RepID=A0ABU9T3T1_9HYPH
MTATDITTSVRTKLAKSNIQSLERASALLDTVAAGGDRGASLTDMSEATGLHSSTVFHLVKTLENLGYLARLGEGKAYFIGPQLFALAANAPQLQTLSLIARPTLDALSADTGEASHLAIRSGAQVMMVAQADAKGMLQISRNMGSTRPIHATAIGKVLLAASLPAERDAIIAQMKFERFTPSTICHVEQFISELARVASQGHAEDNAEFDADIRCIAVALPAFAGRLTIALGISGPVWRMDDAAVVANLDTLRRYATDLTTKLGSTTAQTNTPWT